jgi:perosamine synthetase
MQGPRVEAFEQAIAAYVGARHAVATNSCTTALHLALVLLDVGPGDEVIVPSLSFVATANAVLYCQAVPRFADIDPRTFNVDPESVKRAITRRTKAIMPVDQIGLPAEYGRLTQIASTHRVPIVEDAACALGATYRGKKLGSFGLLTGFSFHPRKIITTGEGGMITTNDEALAAKARILRSQGASRPAVAGRSQTEVFADLGFNYRMTDLQAAIGLEQLKRLDGLIAKRRRLAKRYNESLGALRGLIVPEAPAGTTHTDHSYLLRISADAHGTRDEVLAALNRKGIGAKGGMTAIHLEPLYRRRFSRISLPETERAALEGLLLPLYPSMTQAEQDRVMHVMERLLGHRPARRVGRPERVAVR